MLLKSLSLSSLLLLYSQWAALEVAAAIITAAMGIAPGVIIIAEEMRDWHPVDIIHINLTPKDCIT